MPRQIYSIGTVSVTEGSATFTGQGTAWDLALVVGGILFVEGGEGPAPIAEIVSNTEGVLAFPWPGPTLVGASYAIYLETAQAASAIEANARLAEIARRVQSGTFLQPDATGTLAQRAAHNAQDQGFVYIQSDVDPFLVYIKTGPGPSDWSTGQPLRGEGGSPGLPGVDGIGDRYSVVFSAEGRPGTAEEFRTLFADSVTFPEDLAGSVAVARVAATGEAVFSLRKNGAEFATITFDGADSGVFAGSGVVFVAGDIMTIVAPDPRDDTLAGLLFNIAGNR